MALAILLLAEAELVLAVALVGYDGLGAAPLQLSAQFGAVVCLVAQQPVGRSYLLDKFCASGAIMRLTTCEKDAQKTAFSIADCMDFCVAAAARPTDRLILLPPFPPEAERCALIWVESII